jgi:hypothetical protein
MQLSNPAHSSYQYMLLIDEYKQLDINIQRNYELRLSVIENGYNYSYLKHIFFKRMEKEKKLICVYCQKPLKVYRRFEHKIKPADMVTLEHNTPISKGGLKYDESNFLCACDKCNNERGDLPNYKISETHYIF